MTLCDFLLARYAEEEALALGAVILRRTSIDVRDGFYFTEDGRLRMPARVLAECKANRRIVARLAANWEESGGWGSLMEDIARDLAAPFADHPDYREEWKPDA